MSEIGAQGDLGRLLTIADVAEHLNVSAKQVYLLVHSGELAAIRVGTQWRIEPSMLAAYIEAQYEETRRMALWNQFDYSDLAEFSTVRKERD